MARAQSSTFSDFAVTPRTPAEGGGKSESRKWGKFVGNEQPAQVPPNVDGQSPKDPLFPPVQSPEFHQVHLEVVV